MKEGNIVQWREYPSIASAVEDIPNGPIQDVEDAIPDVYGKALRLYFSLFNAIQELKYDTDEVLMWRGLVTLFALQEHLHLPLSWERVSMPCTKTNPLDIALCRPPDNPRHILFAGSDKLWDGRRFYVLKWGDEKETGTDLLLYSPTTLVYPIADWRNVFAGIPGIKWYDPVRKCFLAAQDVLNEHEREIVYFWLASVKAQFACDQANEAQRVIATHLDQYMVDLDVILTGQDQQLLSFTNIGNENLPELFVNLRKTVRAILPLNMPVAEEPILTNQAFADQICYFELKYAPFNNCLNPESYQIAGHSNVYAFLPISPFLHKFCGEGKLIDKIDMNWYQKGEDEFICATLVLAGKKYRQDYRVVKDVSLEVGLAVPFGDEETNKKTMPLISVWPNNINDIWKKYYIMLDGSKCKSSRLKVSSNFGQNDVHFGDNPYVVQTDYPPYAVPIVRKLDNNSGEVSVGVVIPKVSKPAGMALLTATVAIDFGTSSTMVFKEVDGKVSEINIGTDFPLLITDCDTIRERQMRDYFIPPKEYPRGIGTLFSIYRRSGGLKNRVEPILDGTIYQTSSAVDPVEDGIESDKRYLITNLKWQIRSQKAYYIAFMEQLVLHITTLLYNEGVNSINWKYALPEGMVEGDSSAVQSIWKDELIPYLKNVASNIKYTVMPPLTESEAASRYFLTQQYGPVHAGIGYLVVDIGGGSTDIALWQGNAQNAHMLWHTSVKVAGRKMFTRWIIEALPDLCKGVCNEAIEGQASMIRREELSEDTRNTLVEILLNNNYRDLLECYQQNCREFSDGWGKRLYLNVSRAVSILVFALGYQVGTLLSVKALEIPNELGAFVIAFGGRGSKMLDWMKSVDPNDTGTCNGRLEAVFRSGVEMAGGTMATQLQFYNESNPKLEVSKGLLVDWKVELPPAHTPASVCMNTQKYLDGVKRFIDKFGMYFSTEMQELNLNIIAAQLNQHPEKMNEIVDVFMEIIYEDMTK